MFNWIQYNDNMDFCKYMQILNLMPATHFKKVGTGQQKTGKAGKQVNLTNDDIMNGF